MLKGLLDRLGALRERLRARSTVHVNDQDSKNAAISLASSYFNEVRPQIQGVMGAGLDLSSVDTRWQELVRLAHANNKRQTYLGVVRALTGELRDISVRVLSRAAEGRAGGTRESELDPAEAGLVATLDALLPSAAASYRQGLLDLRQTERLSYRGTASEFRESVRETLDHLAPDEAVGKQEGFKLEDRQTRPTMRQKTRFVLLSRGRGKTQTAVAEKSVGLIESLAGEVMRAAYDRASLATHAETTRAEVLRLKRYVDTVLFDLLEIPEVTAPKSARKT